MKKNRTTLFILILLSSFIFISCGSGSKIVATWQNDQIEMNKIDKILLIGIAKDPWVRKMFESELKEELSHYEVEAVSSLEIVSPDEKITKENFELYFGKENFDAALITHVVAENIEKTRVYNYTPSYGYGGFYGYYGSVYTYAYSPSPGYIVEQKNVNLETNIFDIRSKELAWSAISETFDAKRASDVIDPLVVLIVKEMYDDGLIE